MKPPRRDAKYLWNLSAISAEFHRSKEYKRFYDARGEMMGGFPEIWESMIDLADAFTVEMQRFTRGRQIDDGWIEAILQFVDSAVLDISGWTDSSLTQYARKAVESNVVTV
jgi:hypothetical protein